MDLITLLHAALLGAVEGLTEFIPVSSTGHLILMVDMLGFKSPPGKVFEVLIQFGAICAVIWLYWGKLWNIATTLHKPASRMFASNIIVAFLPAAIVGAIAHDFIKNVLFDASVVCSSLVVGGVIIVLVERLPLKTRIKHIEEFPLLFSVCIGLCQTLALIPGLSRSGSTIIGAMLLGADKKAATEFSFFLAIPTMFGATVFDLYKNYHLLSSENYALIGIGFVCAFLTALLVVKNLIRIVSTYGFAPFGWYRIVVGTGMLLWLTL
ncbi:MAG: undecaprenyl-diphosphate phosphatase [Proteobacteria bacterium]|nr:undecaprenyl-diphosphate phosphatase [Pseudomonadota bacterium]